LRKRGRKGSTKPKASIAVACAKQVT